MKAKRIYLKRVTVENRIMLLLLDHMKEQDSYSVPDVLSQGGMSRKLSVRQNNLSREIQSLVNTGLVVSRSSHILGLQRRRKVYFLTPEGLELTQEKLVDLRNNFVVVRDLKSDLREWKLGKLIDHLSEKLHRKVTAHEVIEEVLEGGEADLGRLLYKKEKKRSMGAPIVKDFYGREEELGYIEDAFDREGPSFVSVISIAGQGKTTLISRYLGENKENYCWIKVNPWLTPERTLTEISISLGEIGSSDLEETLTVGSNVDIDDSVEILIRDASTTGLVVILDDAQVMTSEMVEFFKLVRNKAILSKSSLKILIASRKRPEIYSKTEAELDGDVVEIQLEGLDRGSVSGFLGAKGIPAPLHDDYYEKTKGHPLTIALISNRPDIGPDEIGTALNRMMEEEILSSMTNEELSVVEMVSIMELPIEKEILFDLPGVDRDIVSDLVLRLLLREYGNGTVDLHDLIKDIVKSTISSDKLNDYRRRSYSFYSKRGRDSDIIQTIHFALELGMIGTVVDLISNHGEYLLGKGYPQLVDAVEVMAQRSKDPTTQVRILLLQADSSRYLGDLEKARVLLEKASDKAMTIKDQKGVNSQPYLMSRIIRRLAEIKGLEGSGRDVVELYLRSLSLVESSGDLLEKASVHSDIGMAYLGLREFERSIHHLRSALKILKGLDDKRGTAEIRTNLGIVYYRKLELSNSLRELLFAIRISREGGFERIRNRAMYWVGRLYMTVMQPEEAVPYFRSSVQGYASIKDMVHTERALVGLVSSSLKSGDNKKGERGISKLRRDLKGGKWSILPWARIDLTADVRSLQCHMNLFEVVLKKRKELMISSVGPHLDHLRSEYEGGNIIDAVNSVSWALANDFTGPNMEYLGSIEKEAKRLDDTHVIVAVLYTRATSTHITAEESKSLLREALMICKKTGWHEGKKRVVDYLNIRW
jgi:tetratricopeptide (TPR) repeat protein/DNA-binding MarR family transcriptional regulator